MHSLGFENKNPSNQNMITDQDRQDSNIDSDTFIEAKSNKLGDRESRASIENIFALFDDNGIGTIDFRNQERVACELGETMIDDELREMIQRANTDGDGEISLEDFYKIIVKGKSIDDFYRVLIFDLGS